MRWFEGSIPEAIARAKSTKAVFVVYISGEDEQSRKMDSTFESAEVCAKLEEVGCVAVRLNGNSDVCQQFSQIYHVMLIPSTYFIGDNGLPLEIIGGDVRPEEFLLKVENVLRLRSSSTSTVALPQQQQQQQQMKEVTRTSSENKEDVKGDDTSLETTSQNTSSNESVEGNLEDKVERAKKLIAGQKQQKLKQEIEEEKRKEVDRRKTGQEVQRLRHRQQDVEAKQLVEDLAKERAEERAARERIREQIAKDRAERAMKYQSEKQEMERAKQEAQQAALQEQQEKAAVEAAEKSNFARLQFRFPDGSSLTQQFPADETLETVRHFIEQSPATNLRSFTFSTTFPRREFQQDEYKQTLRELRLAPCAAILIIPVKSSPVVNVSSSWNFIWAILGPFIALFNYLRVLVFGSRGTAASNSVEPTNSSQKREDSSKSNTNSKETSEPGQSGLKQRPKSKVSNRQSNNNDGAGPSFSRREGNIHRFTNPGDDSDDNNTWNGNSTQQM